MKPTSCGRLPPQPQSGRIGPVLRSRWASWQRLGRWLSFRLQRRIWRSFSRSRVPRRSRRTGWSAPGSCCATGTIRRATGWDRGWVASGRSRTARRHTTMPPVARRARLAGLQPPVRETTPATLLRYVPPVGRAVPSLPRRPRYNLPAQYRDTIFQRNMMYRLVELEQSPTLRLDKERRPPETAHARVSLFSDSGYLHVRRFKLQAQKSLAYP